ncbi:GNAT family N-acetyltransferase [Granulicella sp. WH15]|uniref:GNAT family N-acetyltransferase n=1 Tax=Granulicella sp. WH15 TaxID=2602070 RepID=UPI001366857F|nr:GNAT family N-acetyltransferase [Granulicella sp. WH15]QHN01984.1 GNAT family N-acetyltransferase [Granulicella sp. WH15]
MATDPLRNPVWSALSSEQARFRQQSGAVLRYPVEIAPFCAVETASAACSAGDIPAGRTHYFVGVIPQLPPECQLVHRSSVVQMILRGQPVSTEPLPMEVELTATDVDDMLKLTGLVYPAFFRTETHRLGRYIGLRAGGELIAMAGERMRLSGPSGSLCEISGVCTHPAHTGKGYASHLILRLSEAILASGSTPFLHTSSSNRRAISVYEKLGFKTLRELDMVEVQCE